MKYLITITLATFLASCAHAQPSYNTVNVVPNQTLTDTGTIWFQALNGTPRFKVGFSAPLSVAADVRWRLPDADAVGCFGSDGAGNLSIVACSGAGSTPPFLDTTDIIKGSADATKLLRFEVDGFTTATTRTLTPQDASYTIAGTNITNTFTSQQRMDADLVPHVAGSWNVGTVALPFSQNVAVTFISRPAGGVCNYASMTSTVLSGGDIVAQNSACATQARMYQDGFDTGAAGSYRANGSVFMSPARVLTLASGSGGNVASSMHPTSTSFGLGSSNTVYWGTSYLRNIIVEAIAPDSTWQATSTIGTSGLPYSAGWFNQISVSNSVMSNLVPDLDATRNLGSSLSMKWNTMYSVRNLMQSTGVPSGFYGYNSSSQLRFFMGDGVAQGGNMELYDNSGNIKFSIIGDSLTMSANMRISAILYPSATNTYDIGSSSLNWRRVYAQTYYSGSSAGFTGTCTVNPTVVGGIITSC